MNYLGQYHNVVVDAPYMNGESHIISQFTNAEVRSHVDCNCSWWARILGKAKHERPDHEWYRFVIIQETNRG
jgi:hypothetical protein